MIFYKAIPAGNSPSNFRDKSSGKNVKLLFASEKFNPHGGQINEASGWKQFSTIQEAIVHFNLEINKG